MASLEQITTVAKENLFNIFGSHDKQERFAYLEKLWHPSGEILFLEPEKAGTTYEDIDSVIVDLQKNTPGFEFAVVGELQILAAAGNETIARLKWGYGPPGEPYGATGEDIFTIVDGKIKKLYTFLD